MKKIMLFFLLAVATIGNHSIAAHTGRIAPESFIIIDNVVTLTANVYLNAQSVTVELISSSGAVQGSAVTRPGGAVSFALNDASRKLRSTYFLGNDQGFVIIEEQVVL